MKRFLTILAVVCISGGVVSPGSEKSVRQGRSPKPTVSGKSSLLQVRRPAGEDHEII